MEGPLRTFVYKNVVTSRAISSHYVANVACLNNKQWAPFTKEEYHRVQRNKQILHLPR